MTHSTSIQRNGDSRLQALLTRDPEKAAAHPGVQLFTVLEET